MKKITKNVLSRFAAGMLILSIAGSLCACGTEGDDPNKGNGNNQDGDNTQTLIVDTSLTKAPTGQPDYSGATQRMPIGAWNPAPEGGINYIYTDEVLDAAKEVGLDFFCDVRITKYTSTKKLVQALEKIRDAGFKTFINYSGSSYEDIFKAGHLDLDGNVMTEDGVHGDALEIIKEDFVVGIQLWDEPNVDRFDYLEKEAKRFREDFPDKLIYTNLLPNYATNGQLAAGTYVEYIGNAVEKLTSVTHMSYDFYPLLGQDYGDGEVINYGLNSLWLPSLETVSNGAKTLGKDMWVFIQSMSWGSQRGPQSAADITFQNYVNMCYGARGIQYFSFTQPTSSEFKKDDYAMLDLSLNKTEYFDCVKAANEELRTFDNVYLEFTWDNVMPVEGSEFSDPASNGFGDLTTQLTSSKDFKVKANVDTLVGQFHDKNGYKGYMVANMSDPMEVLVSSVTMTFNANRVLVYSNGKSKVVEIPTGEYKFNLNMGAGSFIIPFNA